MGKARIIFNRTRAERRRAPRSGPPFVLLDQATFEKLRRSAHEVTAEELARDRPPPEPPDDKP
jgi:hypothetical protein